MSDAARLRRIVGDFADGRTSCEAAREAVLDLVCERLGVDRVSLWRFDQREPAAGGASLRLVCFAAKRSGGPLEGSADVLGEDEYRDYFNELIERGTFASDDAASDPALQPMRSTYIARYRIASLLDAAFMLNGRAYGMVCCEAIGAPRRWRQADVQALRAIVTRLSVLLASVDVPELWNGPSLPLVALPAEG